MLLIHKAFKNSEANIYSTEDDLDLQDPPGRTELAKPALQSSLSQNEPPGPSPTVNTSDAPADSPADSWDAIEVFLLPRNNFDIPAIKLFYFQAFIYRPTCIYFAMSSA